MNEECAVCGDSNIKYYDQKGLGAPFCSKECLRVWLLDEAMTDLSDTFRLIFKLGEEKSCQEE